MNKLKLYGMIAVILAAIILMYDIQRHNINKLRAERDIYRGNTETLLSDFETYRVRDSLNAARVQSLELTIKEFERFRADDAALIKDLQARNRDLSAVNKTQAQTIIEMRTVPKDTVIIRDSIPVTAVTVHCGDEWFDFHGLLTPDEFTGTLENRESLLLTESVMYKRFCGFLWKTKKILNRELNAVSLNPHTKIVDIEYILIDN